MDYEIESGLGYLYVYDSKNELVGSAYENHEKTNWKVYLETRMNSEYMSTVQNKKEAVQELKNLFEGAKLIS